VFLFFVITLLFTSCKKEPLFSNFDTIEYYHLIIKEDSIIEKIRAKNKDENLIKTINGSFIKKSNGANFISELNSDKFLKKQFSPSDVNNFKKIFNSDVFLDYDTSACAPIYRDFLILKKENSIVGIVQICLHCEMHCIEGNDTRKEKNNFCGSIAGAELATLLNKYK